MKYRHAMPFGAELGPEGVRFAVWAPGARRANVEVDGVVLPMEARDGGFFTRVVANAGAGSRYRFGFDTTDLLVPDPASRFNPDDVHAASEVVDPAAFDWPDGAWRGRAWSSPVIYELHVGTFTAEGTYAAAARHLDHLARLGVDAIELMPLADTPGRRNWGYDGVLPFAPEAGYGRPEDLKQFVAAAHARGMMVLLDVVYNHFGPDGNYLALYAPQFFTARHHTPWGDAINFDDAHAETVRRFFIDNALYWLTEYRFDGLRLDAVHAIADTSNPDFLTELAHTVAARLSGRRVHLVLENDDNAARYLARAQDDRPAAYTAQWNDDFHHAVHRLLTGDTAGLYGDYDAPAEHLLRCLMSGFAYQGEHSVYRGRARGEPSAHLPPDAFVSFLQNHDQVGNTPRGERLWTRVDAEPLRAAETLLLLLPAPILLFMGDELHAASAFPFFCDFTGELAAAVRDGRRRDLAAHFPAADSAADPNAASERDAAVLDWTALERTPHREVLDRYVELIRIRRAYLQPRLPAASAGGRLLAGGAVEAAWTLASGERLVLIANLSARPAPPAAMPGEPLAASSTPPRAGSAIPPWFVGWYLTSSAP